MSSAAYASSRTLPHAAFAGESRVRPAAVLAVVAVSVVVPVPAAV